jgi:hypothetical protein
MCLLRHQQSILKQSQQSTTGITHHQKKICVDYNFWCCSKGISFIYVSVYTKNYRGSVRDIEEEEDEEEADGNRGVSYGCLPRSF